MSKDNKDVKSAVLPKSLSASGAAPLSRTGKPKKLVQRIVEDYVSIAGDDADVQPETEDKLNAVSSSSPSGLRNPFESDTKQPADPPADPSSLASKLEQRIADLTGKLNAEQLILENQYFSRHSERTNPADHKHYYITVGSPTPAFAASGAEVAVCINNPAAGTGVTQRLTSAIACKRIKIRVQITLNPIGVSTSVPVFPTIYTMLIRDKLPQAPGSFPPMWATDGNPPAGASNMYSRLGLAQAISNDYLAVINPCAANRYHVYHQSRHYSRNFAYNVGDVEEVASYVTPAVSKVVASQFKRFDIDIDMHNVAARFNSNSASPQQNAVWLLMRTDFAGAANDAANGFEIDYDWTSDLTFVDVQDD